MQKARLLTDENQCFFSNVPNSLVFYYTLFRKPNSRVQRRSEQYLEVCFCFVFLCVCVKGGGGGEHAQKPVFSVRKKPFIRHFARFNFSRLSLAFILKYYPILHAVKR